MHQNNEDEPHSKFLKSLDQQTLCSDDTSNTPSMLQSDHIELLATPPDNLTI
mgnify:CR=1 FL=1